MARGSPTSGARGHPVCPRVCCDFPWTSGKAQISRRRGDAIPSPALVRNPGSLPPPSRTHPFWLPPNGNRSWLRTDTVLGDQGTGTGVAGYRRHLSAARRATASSSARGRDAGPAPCRPRKARLATGDKRAPRGLPGCGGNEVRRSGLAGIDSCTLPLPRLIEVNDFLEVILPERVWTVFWFGGSLYLFLCFSSWGRERRLSRVELG